MNRHVFLVYNPDTVPPVTFRSPVIEKTVQVDDYMVEFSLKSSMAPGAGNPRNDQGTSAKRIQNGATVLMVESRPLTDLAEKEANKFARKMDRLLETYSPAELENQIFWRVLTRNLEIALEGVKSRIPELRTGRVGAREAIPSFKPKDPF